MSVDKELESWLRLSLVPGLGNSAFRKLLLAFGSPENILSASAAALAQHVAADVARQIHRHATAITLEEVGGWLADPLNRVITLADAEYPRLLLQIPDPPPLLYAKGRVDLLDRPSIAVIGSRQATPLGLETAESFARALSDAGLVIVSGLALGIDAAAHRGGIAGQSSSIAVVGTGLDIVYPARNRELAHALATQGLLISEFPLGTPALAANFPQRNRLLSGLALGCLVVEAALASGSLITARLANEQGREVFAVPGSIHAPHAKGCHHLIKQGAKLTESANDILEELGVPRPGSRVTPAVPDGPLDPRAQALLDQMSHGPVSIDHLCSVSGLSQPDVSALLSILEIQGRVTLLTGGRYQRLR